MKKKKKTKMIYVYIAIIVVLFAGIFAIGNLEKDNILYGMPTSDLNPATRQLLDNPNYQNIILPAELDKKIADKEDFFVYMFSSSCKYCLETTPDLKPLADELNVDLPMFNLLEFTSGFGKYDIEYTPTLIYFQDGVEIERLEGGIVVQSGVAGYTLEDFRAFFTKYQGAGE